MYNKRARNHLYLKRRHLLFLAKLGAAYYLMYLAMITLASLDWLIRMQKTKVVITKLGSPTESSRFVSSLRDINHLTVSTIVHHD